MNDLAGRFSFFDAVIVFLADYLQYILVVVFLLLIYFSVYAKQEKIRIVWVTILSIIVARLGVTEFIRFLYHRPRPFMAHQVNQLIVEHGWSLPSGHATFFFAMATAVYLYNKKWGIGFFISVILISMSRIIAGVHYPSDIIGGAVIGIVVAYVIFYIVGKYEKKFFRC